MSHVITLPDTESTRAALVSLDAAIIAARRERDVARGDADEAFRRADAPGVAKAFETMHQVDARLDALATERDKAEQAVRAAYRPRAEAITTDLARTIEGLAQQQADLCRQIDGALTTLESALRALEPVWGRYQAALNAFGEASGALQREASPAGVDVAAPNLTLRQVDLRDAAARLDGIVKQMRRG